MEGFQYYNMFETKGFEYLLTIVFFLLLIPFWMMLNKKVNIGKRISEAIGVLTARRIKLPKGIYHSPNHTWMHLLRSGVARVGLSDLLLKITGKIELTPLKSAGDEISKGDIVAQIHHDGKVLNIASPLSGKIVSFPVCESEKLLSDPYGNGWMLEIVPRAWIAETQHYYLAETTQSWAEKEIVRFKDFLSESMPKHDPEMPLNALQDGGELREQILAELPEGVWNDFDKQFLNFSAIKK